MKKAISSYNELNELFHQTVDRGVKTLSELNNLLENDRSNPRIPLLMVPFLEHYIETGKRVSRLRKARPQQERRFHVGAEPVLEDEMGNLVWDIKNRLSLLNDETVGVPRDISQTNPVVRKKKKNAAAAAAADVESESECKQKFDQEFSRAKDGAVQLIAEELKAIVIAFCDELKEKKVNLLKKDWDEDIEEDFIEPIITRQMTNFFSKEGKKCDDRFIKFYQHQVAILEETEQNLETRFQTQFPDAALPSFIIPAFEVSFALKELHTIYVPFEIVHCFYCLSELAHAIFPCCGVL